MPTTLVITNDFPPGIGGIEAFIAQISELLGDVVVLTGGGSDSLVSRYAADVPASTDSANGDYPIHRQRGVLLPTSATAAAAVGLMDRYGANRIIYGAAAPLGLLAPRLARAGATHQLAISHGHETAWARLPGPRSTLHRIGEHVSAISYVSEFTRDRIAPALSPTAQRAMLRLAPPVDTERFQPTPKPDRPTVIAAGRMVGQKGFDTLLAAWEMLLRNWAGLPPELVLIGSGPQHAKLAATATRLRGSVRLTGPVSHREMPDLLAAGHVFALPVRTRFAGLNPEGFGMVFAEAAACGLAVLAGASGGTADTMVNGESGFLLDPSDPALWARTMRTLLRDPGRTERMGQRGRAHVLANFAPTQTAAVLRQVLDLPGPPPSA